MKRLTSLRITRVATVDTPDNPPAQIVLFKRKQKDDRMSEKQQADLDGLNTKIAELEKQRDEVTALKDEAKKQGSLLEKLAGLFGKSDKVDFGTPELNDAMATIQKERETEKAALQKTQDELATLRKQRDMDQMISKALEVSHMGPPDDLAGQLLKVRDALGEEDFAKYFQTQLGIAEQLKASGLFKAAGSESNGDVGGEDKLTAMAKEAHGKDTSKTFEQHYTEVLKTDEGKALWEAAQIDIDDRIGRAG